MEALEARLAANEAEIRELTEAAGRLATRIEEKKKQQPPRTPQAQHGAAAAATDVLRSPQRRALILCGEDQTFSSPRGSSSSPARRSSPRLRREGWVRLDKPEKPPWDFSGPDPPPVERTVRPIPPAFLTAARVRQMVEKVLGRLWHLHMRVGKARSVADSGCDHAYEVSESALSHILNNPSSHNSKRSVEEAKVMRSLRGLAMQGALSEKQLYEKAEALALLEFSVEDHAATLRAHLVWLVAKLQKKPSIEPSGGSTTEPDPRLLQAVSDVRAASELVDEAGKVVRESVRHTTTRLAACSHEKVVVHSATHTWATWQQRQELTRLQRARKDEASEDVASGIFFDYEPDDPNVNGSAEHLSVEVGDDVEDAFQPDQLRPSPGVACVKSPEKFGLRAVRGGCRSPPVAAAAAGRMESTEGGVDSTAASLAARFDVEDEEGADDLDMGEGEEGVGGWAEDEGEKDEDEEDDVEVDLGNIE
jgi:hypothetical protein